MPHRKNRRKRVQTAIRNISALHAKIAKLEQDICSMLTDPIIVKAVGERAPQKALKQNKYDRRRSSNMEWLESRRHSTSMKKLFESPAAWLKAACSLLAIREGHDVFWVKQLNALMEKDLVLPHDLQPLFMKTLPPPPITRKEVGGAISRMKGNGFNLAIHRGGFKPLCLTVKPQTRVHDVMHMIKVTIEQAALSGLPEVGLTRSISWPSLWKTHKLAVTTSTLTTISKEPGFSILNERIGETKIRKILKKANEKMRGAGIGPGSVLKIVPMKREKRSKTMGTRFGKNTTNILQGRQGAKKHGKMDMKKHRVKYRKTKEGMKK